MFNSPKRQITQGFAILILVVAWTTVAMAGRKTSQGGGLGYACFANSVIASQAFDRTQGVIRPEFMARVTAVEVLENIENVGSYNRYSPSSNLTGKNPFEVARQHISDSLWYVPYFAHYVSEALLVVEEQWRLNLRRPSRRIPYVNDSGLNISLGSNSRCIPVNLAKWSMVNNEFKIEFDYELIQKILSGNSPFATWTAEPRLKIALLYLHEALYKMGAHRHSDSKLVREFNAAIFFSKRTIEARFQGNIGGWFSRFFQYINEVGFNDFAEIPLQSQAGAANPMIVGRRNDYARLLSRLTQNREVIRYYIPTLNKVIIAKDDLGLQELLWDSCSEGRRNGDCNAPSLQEIKVSSESLKAFNYSLSEAQSFLLIALTIPDVVGLVGEHLLLSREKYLEELSRDTLCRAIERQLEEFSDRQPRSNHLFESFQDLYLKGQRHCKQMPQ